MNPKAQIVALALLLIAAVFLVGKVLGWILVHLVVPALVVGSVAFIIYATFKVLTAKHPSR